PGFQNKFAKTLPRLLTCGMAAQPEASWQQLFAGADTPGPVQTVPFRVVIRSGRPFLILPADPHAAARSLSLYSAQTARARAARWLLPFAFNWKLPTALARASLPTNRAAPFPAFLAKTAGTTDFPRVAILPSNSAANVRRFILLVLNAHDQPIAVVKAGL